MTELRFTLLSDGSSDRALIPVLRWLLIENRVRRPIQADWADLRRLREPPRRLADRIRAAVEYYPCDVLFLHRDSERVSLDQRHQEMDRAVREAVADMHQVPRTLYVVPVRMFEAWLLFDEGAIRRAAGNPSATHPLDLPRLSELEGLPDPKTTLEKALRHASGLSGRRLHDFRVGPAIHRLADEIGDFSALRELPAFGTLETLVQEAVRANGWDLLD